MKPIKDMEYGELVDYASGVILQELLRGNLRDGVWHVLSMAVEWKIARQEADL